MEFSATTPIASHCPNLGTGIGLRTNHYNELLKHDNPQVGWLEALSENYLATGGRPRYVLRQLSERYPIVLHGVSLSIGGSSALDLNYLALLKGLAEETRARWISDHLCWTGFAHHNLHDLLPLPFTEESFCHVRGRVNEVQDFLQRPILLENPSSYASFSSDTIAEAQFLRELALQTGCGILLDVNNVYVSTVNHGLNAHEYIDTLPAEAIGQYHLAGHSPREGYVLDSHIGPVPQVVWDLFQYTLRRIGQRSTLIEWDEEIPELAELLLETRRAETIIRQSLKSPDRSRPAEASL